MSDKASCESQCNQRSDSEVGNTNCSSYQQQNSVQDSSSSSIRSPREETLDRVLNGSSDENTNENYNSQSKSHVDIAKSNLSVTAAEFVPRAKQTEHICEDSVSDKGSGKVKTYTLSASAEEFVPMYSNNYDCNQEFYEIFNRLNTRPARLNAGPCSTDRLVDAFKTALFQLTTHPGNVDDYLIPVLDIFDKENLKEESLNEIIEVLFEQSVMEPNFRYTGARVCKYLSNLLKGSGVKENQEFRTLFLKRCQLEYEKREELAASESSIPRLCGLSLFFAELFLILEVEKDGFFEKLMILRSAVKDLLMTLLACPQDTTVKCAAQMLKLTGATIEDTENLSTDSSSFEDVYKKVKELESLPTLNDTSRYLLSSVLNNKADNWGRKEASGMQVIESTYNTGAISEGELLQNEPVFYNEEGHPITREEAGYGQEELYHFGYPGLEFEELDIAPHKHGDYFQFFPDEYLPSGEENVMDEEMEEDFEQFLLEVQEKNKH